MSFAPPVGAGVAGDDVEPAIRRESRTGRIGKILQGYDRNRPAIEDIDLRTRYGNRFYYVTIFMIFLGIVALGFVVFLIVDELSNSRKLMNIVSSSTIAVILIVLTIVLGAYYYFKVLPELRITDKLVTDLTRRATVGSTEKAFRDNLGNLIGKKIGDLNTARRFVNYHIGFTDEGVKNYENYYKNRVYAARDPTNYVTKEQAFSRRLGRIDPAAAPVVVAAAAAAPDDDDPDDFGFDET